MKSWPWFYVDEQEQSEICRQINLMESDPARPLMEEALHAADAIMEEGRDSVRGLRADHLSIDDLANELTKVGSSFNARNVVYFGDGGLARKSSSGSGE